MDQIPRIKIGTATVANGSKNVTFSASLTGLLARGDKFSNLGGSPWTFIDTVTDGQNIILAENWSGTALAGDAYQVEIVAEGAELTLRTRNFISYINAMQSTGKGIDTDGLPLPPDCWTDLELLGNGTTTPPGSPANGDSYLLGATPTGVWAGHGAQIAHYIDGGWRFMAVFGGLRASVKATGVFMLYSSLSSTWISPSGSADLLALSGTFVKADLSSAAFVMTASGAVSVKAGTVIGLNTSVFNFAAQTAVQMPALNAGTDYAVYICNDGTLCADANFSAPNGFTAATSRQVGGFHYAPGGNAAAQAGGDANPAINPYSIWDLKWRPSCPDPRGMALIANRFWCDIYLCNVTPDANGTSRYNMTIADGSSPPKKPTAFGGDGNAAYGEFNWWEAAEVMSAAGKQLLNYDEFAAAMYGTTEEASCGADPATTSLIQAYTSKWGIMDATGVMWVWGRDFNYCPGTGAAGWKDQAQGRGQLFLSNDTGLVPAIFGGHWGTASFCGSRASDWVSAPWDSYSSIGARGRCDHLRLV